jgi:hypothetical protein
MRSGTRGFGPLMALHVGKHGFQDGSDSVSPFPCDFMVALHGIDPPRHGQHGLEHVAGEGGKGAEPRVAPLQFEEQGFEGREGDYHGVTGPGADSRGP